MKTFVRRVCGFLFLVVLACSSASFADVRISLRNGRNITAEACQWQGSTLTCTKMGGNFTIDKKDVAGIKETGGGSEDGAQEPSVTETPAEGGSSGETGGVEAEDGKTSSETEKEGSTAAGELPGIRQRKGELLAEREKLVKERGQLQNDIKNSPDWMAPERFEELQRKSRGLDERISRFNEEVKILNEKEKKITEGMKQEAK